MEKIKNPTKEQIAELKEKHPGLKAYKVGNAVFLFKPVDRQLYKIAKSAVLANPKRPDPNAFSETILKNACVWNADLLKDLAYSAPLEDKVDSLISGYFESVGELEI